jgi:hypothetical protein
MSKVSTSLFDGYGFKQTDAALSVKLLKFLGAIDDEGNATSVMEKLRLESEDKRRQAFEEIVRNAYSHLFNAVKEPHNLPKTELSDEFKVQYNQSPRVVMSAVPVFLKLCEYAGLKEKGTVSARTSKPREKNNVSRTERKSNRHTATDTHIKPPTAHGFHAYPVAKDKMTIIVPEDWYLESEKIDDLHNKWRAVVKAAHTYAESMNKEEEPESEQT